MQAASKFKRFASLYASPRITKPILHLHIFIFSEIVYNSNMLMIDMIQWWYTVGWKTFLTKYANRLRDAADFFSLRLLVQNMFAPFRQISANAIADQSMGARIAVFFDRLLSRLIGAFVRLFLLILGLVIILVQAVLGLVTIVVWPLAPLAVVGCVILAIMQVRL